MGARMLRWGELDIYAQHGVIPWQSFQLGIYIVIWVVTSCGARKNIFKGELGTKIIHVFISLKWNLCKVCVPKNELALDPWGEVPGLLPLDSVIRIKLQRRIWQIGLALLCNYLLDDIRDWSSLHDWSSEGVTPRYRRLVCERNNKWKVDPLKKWAIQLEHEKRKYDEFL